MADPKRDPIAEQLAEWRERFTNRRTVPWEMLELAEAMIRAAAEHHRHQYEVALATLREEHAARVEVLQSTIDGQSSTIDSLKRQAEERRSLNEARRDAGDGDAEVTIRRDDHLKAWRLSDLEEIAFRLRCGGATDDTPVDMASNRAIAVVPVPNLVTLEHRPTQRELQPVSAPPPPVGRRLSLPEWRLALGLAVVALSAVVGAVLFG